MAQPLDLDAITARHEMYATIHSASGAFAHCAAQESAEDVPALIAEVTRLWAEQARLADFLRAGQQWRNGRLVIESCPSQPEIRAALGWPEPTAPTV